MCIDLFRFGQRLDIEFLAEQIWFRVKQDNPAELDTSQVYDLLIKNPKGSPECREVWALFPHSCQKDDGTYRIESLSLVPPGPGEPPVSDSNARYNWLFADRPSLERGQDGGNWIEITPKVDHDFPESEDHDAGTLSGKLLTVDCIDFPDIYERLGWTVHGNREDALKRCAQVMASDAVCKTLVRISFRNTPLQETEAGWLRLLVRPVTLAKPKVKPVIFPGVTACPNVANPDDYAVSYEQKMEITCPRYLRLAVLEKLQDGDRATQALWTLVNELNHNGTSTRIEDHRLALVAPTDTIDIYDAVPTTRGVLFHGTADLPKKHTAHLWTSGSRCNLEDDLIHNAMRVIQKLAQVESISYDALASQLAPSTKFEAFSLLLRIMRDDTQMVTLHGANYWTIKDAPQDIKSPPKVNRDCFNFNELRQIYARRKSQKHDEGLIKQFKDLHPFRIHYRVIWPRPTDKCVRLVSLMLEQAQTEGSPSVLRI